MFGIFKKKSETPANATGVIAHRRPFETFPWPKGEVLTALDEVTIALPIAAFGSNEKIGSVVLGSPDIGLSIPKTGDKFFIRLQPGMSVSLTKSCEACIFADDWEPRRFKICPPS
jgi:hypothetical protein